MATTFATFDDWTGRIDCMLELGGDSPPGVAGLPEEGFTWGRSVYTLTMEREGDGLSVFTSVEGEIYQNTSLTIKNGPDSLNPPARGSVDTYRCESNTVEPTAPGSGHWRETQIWVLRSPWQETELNPEL